jgi:hypothetical protein
MASDDGEPQLAKWFRENYPVENAYVNTLMQNTNPIFQQISANIAEGQQIPIYMAAQKINGKLNFVITDIGIVFLGSIIKTIVDTILNSLPESEKLNAAIEKKAKEVTEKYFSHIIPSIPLQNFRRCPKCNLDNDYKNKFCTECGTKLPES